MFHYKFSIIYRSTFKIIAIILFLFCTKSSFSQSDRQLKTNADASMANKDWFSAAQYYNRLFFRDSSSIDLQYTYAEASRLNFEDRKSVV